VIGVVRFRYTLEHRLYQQEQEATRTVDQLNTQHQEEVLVRAPLGVGVLNVELAGV